jgi:hypothetical protein
LLEGQAQNSETPRRSLGGTRRLTLAFVFLPIIIIIIYSKTIENKKGEPEQRK